MSKPKTPEGWHTITPRLVANDPQQLIVFLKDVFGATGEYLETRPSVITVGDSQLMIGNAEIRRPSAAFLYVYVDDLDATYRRALAANARSLEVPFDTPYGDRRCMIEDNWGNTWQIASLK
jgi:PhnB protein